MHFLVFNHFKDRVIDSTHVIPSDGHFFFEFRIVDFLIDWDTSANGFFDFEGQLLEFVWQFDSDFFPVGDGIHRGILEQLVCFIDMVFMDFVAQFDLRNRFAQTNNGFELSHSDGNVVLFKLRILHG